MTLRRRRDLAWQQIGAELVVMSLPEKKVLGLNPTGALLWSRGIEFEGSPELRPEQGHDG